MVAKFFVLFDVVKVIQAVSVCKFLPFRYIHVCIEIYQCKIINFGTMFDMPFFKNSKNKKRHFLSL